MRLRIVSGGRGVLLSRWSLAQAAGRLRLAGAAAWGLLSEVLHARAGILSGRNFRRASNFEIHHPAVERRGRLHRFGPSVDRPRRRKEHLAREPHGKLPLRQTQQRPITARCGSAETVYVDQVGIGEGRRARTPGRFRPRY